MSTRAAFATLLLATSCIVDVPELDEPLAFACAGDADCARGFRCDASQMRCVAAGEPNNGGTGCGSEGCPGTAPLCDESLSPPACVNPCVVSPCGPGLACIVNLQRPEGRECLTCDENGFVCPSSDRACVSLGTGFGCVPECIGADGSGCTAIDAQENPYTGICGPLGSERVCAACACSSGLTCELVAGAATFGSMTRCVGGSCSSSSQCTAEAPACVVGTCTAPCSGDPCGQLGCSVDTTDPDDGRDCATCGNGVGCAETRGCATDAGGSNQCLPKCAGGATNGANCGGDSICTQVNDAHDGNSVLVCAACPTCTNGVCVPDPNTLTACGCTEDADCSPGVCSGGRCSDPCAGNPCGDQGCVPVSGGHECGMCERRSSQSAGSYYECAPEQVCVNDRNGVSSCLRNCDDCTGLLDRACVIVHGLDDDTGVDVSACVGCGLACTGAAPCVGAAPAGVAATYHNEDAVGCGGWFGLGGSHVGPGVGASAPDPKGSVSLELAGSDVWVSWSARDQLRARRYRLGSGWSSVSFSDEEGGTGISSQALNPPMRLTTAGGTPRLVAFNPSASSVFALALRGDETGWESANLNMGAWSSQRGQDIAGSGGWLAASSIDGSSSATIRLVYDDGTGWRSLGTDGFVHSDSGAGPTTRVANNGSSAWVAWERGAGGIFAKHADLSSGTVSNLAGSANPGIHDNVPGCHAPDVAMDGGGRVFVSYRCDRDGAIGPEEVFLTSFRSGDADWGWPLPSNPPSAISPFGTPGSTPALALGGSTPFLAVRSPRDATCYGISATAACDGTPPCYWDAATARCMSAGQVTLVRWQADAWYGIGSSDLAQGVSYSPFDVRSPAVAVDNTRVCVAWVEVNPGQPDRVRVACHYL